MSDWIHICALNDIPALGARRVARDSGLDVAIFRNEADGVLVLLDRCPHRGGPLSQGIVLGNSVACPLHNWTIGCDGQADAPDEGCTPSFSVKLEQGQVYLDAAQLAEHATEQTRPIAGPLSRKLACAH